jgi:hypothetical protein
MSTEITTPDFDWYSRLSRARGLPPRCSFQSVERCPRYWQSLSLIGELGSTKIDAKRDEKLLRRWERSEHWPATAEYATCISGSKDEHDQWKSPALSNFCPETTYDRFGYFASSMSRYADETDSGLSHERLGKMRAPANDSRWAWAHVRAMHFSECPYYSLLGAAPKPSDDRAADVTLKIPYVAEIKFKLRFRQLWERVKKALTRIGAGIPRRG